MSMQTPWVHRYAQRTQLVASSAIRELLKYTEKPDIISFAGGLPAPEVFPVEEFRVACDRVLRENGAQALQYSTTEGLLPLREMIARHSSRKGSKPSVVLNCRACAPFSRRTRSQATLNSSTGKTSGAGNPPANEMMSGFSVYLSNSRMAELATSWVRCA